MSMAYDKTTFPKIIEYLDTHQVNYFTWKEVGIHYATLGALVQRGYLYKDNNGYYFVENKGFMFAEIERKTRNCEYFCLRKQGAKLGMMCSIKGADILDAWEKVWDWGNEPVMLSYHKPNSTEILIGKES